VFLVQFLWGFMGMDMLKNNIACFAFGVDGAGAWVFYFLCCQNI
jgi:hypothetical protein